jgi:histidinol dehydrogenase
MNKFLSTRDQNFNNQLSYFLEIRKKNSESKESIVRKIVKDIRKNQDVSLIKYEKKFSGIKKLNKKNLFFSKSELKKSLRTLSRKTKKDIDLAYNRILNFHKNQKVKTFSLTDKFKNRLEYRTKPIEKVGVYVPGGNASYPSSVLMNCIPAIVAGVPKIFMTVPSINKVINPGILYAAKKCKVKKIYKLGGAQAVAAFAYGTETVEKVDKVIGPGNAFVALAKKEVFGEVGIDMFAGPSEVTIIADKYSNPEWIAADLIAQAEHDELSQSILITESKELTHKVKRFINYQINFLPKKKTISHSLKNFGLIIFVKNIREATGVVNKISPEHLQICTKKPESYLKLINNAGSIFIGSFSPEAMGDYIAGPNHVLPTSGTARFSSGLSVIDFLKRQSVIKISKSGIERLGPSVINLANYENLHGHASSVRMRIKGKN